MKSREVSDGHKLSYYGTWGDRNGMAVAVAERLPENISLFKRTNDWLLDVKNHENSKVMRWVTACAPQTRCSVSEKDQFWMDLGY